MFSLSLSQAEQLGKFGWLTLAPIFWTSMLKVCWCCYARNSSLQIFQTFYTYIYAIMRHMSSFRLRWWPGRYEVPCSVITRKRGGVIFSNGLSMLWSDHSYRPLKSRPSFLPSLFIINKNCIHLQQFVNKIWLELKFLCKE